uniref:Uncharacterized protein n=1 Tax=Oryza sativa subsp. japonica TaxID=39947 RepID=Q8S7J8_ORYSJ|nr:Hypothetical protein [Oryza sativa Japonica Group]
MACKVLLRVAPAEEESVAGTIGGAVPVPGRRLPMAVAMTAVVEKEAGPSSYPFSDGGGSGCS